MKVLFVTNMFPMPSLQHYGIFVKEQIDRLQQHFGIVPKLYFINARTYGKWEYVKSIFQVRSILRRDTIDAIHIHYGISGIFLFLFRPKVKVFLTLHGGDILREQGFFLQNFLSKFIMRKVDKVFVLNNEMTSVAIKLGVDFELLPCGVDTDFFKPGPKVDHSIKRIVFPGDPSLMVKNFPLFEQAFRLLATHSKFEVTYSCLHNLSRREVREMLVGADCLLMTSISEGSPQVIKEALSCNLPVVSVDVGDVAEVLRDVPSCAISPDRKPHNLARLVEEVLAHRSGEIRSVFLAKGIYDNRSVCRRLVENYATQ